MRGERLQVCTVAAFIHSPSSHAMLPTHHDESGLDGYGGEFDLIREQRFARRVA
jgi:hypothetical protein